MTARICASPIGPITLAARDNTLTRVWFSSQRPPELPVSDAPVLLAAERQLEEYFAGVRRAFDLPLRAEGTPFRRLCWEALLAIPYGRTCSYGEIARRIGRPAACRAVGQANHHNPLPIFVPCHRVVGANGALTGFGGGLDIKEFLLTLERKHSEG